ncbi:MULTISPECIES: IclR family transcriptional regulator [Arthrobacter]|uniref:IclR family transcriptional regulator n=1 Tax=Arthrobacter terricola TaxID=2547396 RepID=A0A4R5K9P0_9MICC|nr:MULTISPECIES: helix-turn-helix domain-containing protein [Arthrobacter]MBT8162890.1 helix-turn-helix domain-containing protein [Arthrobacter sp. GN70]TDF91883.1 IclR family transcriptional regulator [Arthrobacter terricola]
MGETSTRTVDRAIDLLAVVCDTRGMTLADCARATDLSASTALRLLRTLEAKGFVQKTEEGLYSPGRRIMQLGAAALSEESLIDYCKADMEALVSDTGESTYLSVPGFRETAIYISIIEGTHSVRHTSWVGRTIPLAGTAAGEALVGRVAPGAYVVVEKGVEADVTAIAAPVLSGRRVVAALSLVIPSYRLNEVLVARYGELLAATAGSLSSGLSHEPGVPTAALSS